MMKEKMLPSNIEAEQAVLGSLLIDPEAMSLVMDILVPDDFYRQAHTLIYEAILTLWINRRESDFVTVCDVLLQGGHLEDIGGASYVASLVNAVPTSGNVTYYAEIVERKSLLRRLIFAATQIAANAYAEEEDALAQAEETVYAIRQKKTTREAMSLASLAHDYMTDLDFLHEHKGELIGIPTGFIDLDAITGGLQKTDLITLAARPGMGKSSFASNIALWATYRGHPTSYFSLEMGKKQVMARLLSQRMGIPLQALRTGQWEDDDWFRITDGMGKLSELPLYIDDSGRLSPSSLASKVKRQQAEYGIELVIVDYIGLMSVQMNGKDYENKVQEVAKITRELKTLAIECNIPILALSQLSRKCEERSEKRPLLSDLRDSGSVEQDSDMVLFLYRDDIYKREAPFDGKAEVIVAKHRNGPIGVIDLLWNGEYTRFQNVEAI